MWLYRSDVNPGQVHRIGRTGRAGVSGIAISFASSKELNELSRIERYIGEALPEQVVPGLEPTRSLRPMTAKKKGGWQQHTVTARYSRGKNWGSTNKEKNVIVEYRNSKASRQARRTS